MCSPQIITRRIRYVNGNRRFICVVDVSIDVDYLAKRLGTKAAKVKSLKAKLLGGKIHAAVHSIQLEAIDRVEK